MKALLLVLSLALGGMAGCKRNPGTVTQVPIEQIPATLTTAFSKAAPDVKSVADEAIASLQSQDSPTAFLDFRDLCARADLTPDQRSVAASAMVAVSKQLRAAAESGDKKAEDFLRSYMGSR